MTRAIFIDRDGTINVEKDYLTDPDQLEFIDGSPEAVALANRLGLKVVVISNQSGVSKGIMTADQVDAVNARLIEMLKEKGAHVDAIYYCPHHPAAGDPRYRLSCACRKPGRGMLDRAVRELNVDLSRSYVIGDRHSDVETAVLHGLRSVLVLTGYGRGEWEHHRQEWKYQPDWVCENLQDGVKTVLADMKSGRGA